MSVCVLMFWPLCARAQTQAAIVGGASSHEAAVVMLVDGEGRAFCSGSLIEPDLVLTAGHCVEGHSDVGVRAQSADLRWSHRRVVRTLVHPSFEPRRLDADLALLALDAPIDIPPADLEEELLDERWVGRALRVVGFGLTDPRDASSAGERREREVFIESLTPDRIRHGESSCDGDSGGPVFVETETGPRIVGVVSGGPVGCAHYGRATRVDAHAEWLALGARAALEPAQCSAGHGDPPGWRSLIALLAVLSGALRASRVLGRIN